MAIRIPIMVRMTILTDGSIQEYKSPQGGKKLKLFDPANRHRSDRHAEVWAIYELAHTLVDFTAAGMFVIGSVLFFFPSTTYAGTWLFLIGSIFFGLKPTIRLAREIKLLTLGKTEIAAEKLDN